MGKVAIAIMCKTPSPGASKTRLSPPLTPTECAAASACFITDLSNTIHDLSLVDEVAPYAVYTPIGSEISLRKLLPDSFHLTPQCEGDFGLRLLQGIIDLLDAGHDGAILVNSNSPTLPKAVLQQAVDAVRRGDNVTLSPAIDGGYTLIGLTKAHVRLFEDIPWSTSDVFRLTLERAKEIGLKVEIVHGWYDVDDAESLKMLEDEFAGKHLSFMAADVSGAGALATRQFMKARRKFSSGDKIVSIVIPCLNEAEPIRQVVTEVLSSNVDQVIVVDNGSTDNTAAEAKAAGATVVSEPVRGYGRACAAGLRAVRSDADIVCFMDGDGSDVPAFISAIVEPIANNDADFVIGSRLRGTREPGSMTPQQLVAGWIAGILLRATYGVRFTDMSPFRAMRVSAINALGMREQTYGWNLEMQMRVAAARLRILEIPVDHRCRRGGTSKVSGNLVAGLKASWKITTTFLRLAASLRSSRSGDFKPATEKT